MFNGSFLLYLRFPIWKRMVIVGPCFIEANVDSVTNMHHSWKEYDGGSIGISLYKNSTIQSALKIQARLIILMGNLGYLAATSHISDGQTDSAQVFMPTNSATICYRYSLMLTCKWLLPERLKTETNRKGQIPMCSSQEETLPENCMWTNTMCSNTGNHILLQAPLSSVQRASTGDTLVLGKRSFFLSTTERNQRAVNMLGGKLELSAFAN